MGSDLDKLARGLTEFCAAVRQHQADRTRPPPQMVSDFQLGLERGLLTLDNEGWCWPVTHIERNEG